MPPARNGTSQSPTAEVRGEVVGDSQISSDRYRVIAGAKMLIATPEMM